jgi:hypothetical protein
VSTTADRINTLLDSGLGLSPQVIAAILDADISALEAFLNDQASGAPAVEAASSPVATVTPVPYAAAITPQVGAGETIVNVGVLTGNVTVNNPGGDAPTDGQVLRFRFSQDATGGRTVTWGTEYAFGTDVPSTDDPSTASANWELLFSWHAGSSKWRALQVARGF